MQQKEKEKLHNFLSKVNGIAKYNLPLFNLNNKVFKLQIM